MPDSNSSPTIPVAILGKDYLTEGSPATPSLRAVLAEKMALAGSLRFPDFMATVLYEPSLGYYARQSRQVGRAGDFFTSVSVGPLFGELLARRFLKEWKESGSPGRWRIIEIGAHDGTLAGDILSAMARLEPLALRGLEYAIPEPLPVLQGAQRKTLQEFSNIVKWVGLLDELSAEPVPGIAFGNELLDALPFHVVEWVGEGWQECRVALDAVGEFCWKTVAVSELALLEFLDRLGTDFPVGYRTEVRPHLKGFLEPLTRCLSSGIMIWPDYGFARPEYYHPDRIAGTLRTFSKHRAAENPLESPGEIDITAHVDFTAVAEAALELGCQPTSFTSQGVWLTRQAQSWLLDQEGSPDVAGLRQFQTLTHPAHLGGSFHVLELSWNQGKKPLSTSDSHRLALQACRAPESP
jgi:SAM-dependent MidA family methyltransferase